MPQIIFNFFFPFPDLTFSSSLLDHMPNLAPGSFEDDDEEDTLPLSGNNTFGLLPLNINLAGQPRYQCYSCEQPDCSEETICYDAFQVSILFF